MSTRRRGQGVAALRAAALTLVVTVAVAAFLLPGRVDVYYTPTDRPDVVYELWQYLALVVVISPVMALAVAWAGSSLSTLVMLFVLPDSPVRGTGADTNIGAWLAAWTLLWAAGFVWLAVGFGNDEPVTRSWCELLLVLVGFVGTAAVIGGHPWRAARRVERRKRPTKVRS